MTPTSGNNLINSKKYLEKIIPTHVTIDPKGIYNIFENQMMQ